MDFREQVIRNRCIRRFQQDKHINRQELMDLVDLARQTASARNLQPLKYCLTWQPEWNEQIFPLVKWAGYISDWGGPVEGERPAAYLVILGDREISENFTIDTGIAAQTILLGAVAKGYNGCLLRSFEAAEVRRVLMLPAHLEPQLIIALGVAAERSVLETVGADGSIRYWRDEDGVFHVPKRPLDEIVVQLPG